MKPKVLISPLASAIANVLLRNYREIVKANADLRKPEVKDLPPPAATHTRGDRETSYQHVTFMMCVPRSRSKWLTEFLKPIATTMHDPLKQCESIADLQYDIDQRLRIAPERPVFVADTAAVFFIDDIVARFPGAKYLFVRRTQEDVALSLTRAGFAIPSGNLVEAYKAFEHATHVVIEKGLPRYGFYYHSMNDCLYDIWQFVGGDAAMSVLSLDEQYVKEMCTLNIQVPLVQQNAETNIAKVTKLFESRRRG